MHRLAVGGAVGGALVGLTVGGVLAVGSPGDRAASKSSGSCHVGTIQSAPPIAEEEAGGIKPTTPHIVIACGTLPRQGPFRVVAYRQSTRREAKTVVCIDVEYIALKGGSGDCSPRTLPRRGEIEIRGVNTSGTNSALYGTTSARAARVSLRYREGGSITARKAPFFRIADRALLSRIEVRHAFGYYVAEVPPKARRISVAALDRAGRTLDVARVPKGFGPLGPA
jgi:hypothetical protein